MRCGRMSLAEENTNKAKPEKKDISSKPTYEELLFKVKELEESESLYHSFADNTSDLFYRTDKEGIITYVSKSVYELSGYTVEESIGKRMAEDIYLIPGEREKFLYLLRKNRRVNNFTARLKRKDGSIWWASTNAHYYLDRNGDICGVEGITRDITSQKNAQEAQAKLISELKDAITRVRTLSGLLPICASCKKIRDDRGYWNQIELYIREHSEAEFSHGICPDCAKKIYSEFDLNK